MLTVIGAGFGRTGTLSLKAALELLGCGPCYHMTDVFEHPNHVALWQAAVEGEPPDWEALFAAYHAAVDWPACAFYEQLLQRYPEAKVVLTIRDPEAWYESARTTIYHVSGPEPGTPPPHLADVIRMIRTLIWQQTFDGRFEDKQHAISVFTRHNDAVVARVPPERLLVYNLREGWDPLCRFLGVAAPAERPFPHLNDRATFLEHR